VLSDIPAGAICYLDATIFYYHIVGVLTLSDECSDFLKRIELGDVHGATSSVALAEATHKVMLAEVV
jgi:predicted nucleic acid-binding protein